jgi:hypothetical protein
MDCTYEQIIGFSGINRDVASFLGTKGEYAEVQNLHTPKIGVLKKTGDYEIKGAQITNNYNILGGIDWLRADGTHLHLVACDGVSNADIYQYVTDTWTAQSQSLTAGSKVRFTYSPSLDTLFAVSYSDATRSYNGSAWSTSTNVTSCPQAYYIIEFGRRIYVLNCYITATAYPTRAYRSSLVDSGTITWDTTNDWIVFDDVLSGVGKLGENMLVGCKNSMWSFSLNDEKYQISGHGCVSHESIASYGAWGFWASRDGVYGHDGGSDQKISLPIQEYWDAIPEASLANIQAKVLGHNLYVSIGDVTVGGRALTNVVFNYDILRNDWNRMSLADTVKHLHPYVTSSGQRLFMGNDDGEVFQMFASETQNTATISSFLETNWIDGSDIKAKDTFYELWGFGKRLNGLKVSYKLDNDDNDWEGVGELNGSIASVKFKATGNRIKFLLEENSKNSLYELEQLQIGYVPAYVPEKLEDR